MIFILRLDRNDLQEDERSVLYWIESSLCNQAYENHINSCFILVDNRIALREISGLDKMVDIIGKKVSEHFSQASVVCL